jgi:hypothetical protein
MHKKESPYANVLEKIILPFLYQSIPNFPLNSPKRATAKIIPHFIIDAPLP